MARSLNKIMIIGNVGRDPQMRYTPNGKPVTNFSVAVSRTTRSAEGENRDETQWFNVEAWDRLGETCNEFLHKGSRVYIEGRLRTREYQDRNGVNRTAVEIVANDMMMLDGRQADRPAGGGQPGERPSEGEASGGGDELDEMPF